MLTSRLHSSRPAAGRDRREQVENDRSAGAAAGALGSPLLLLLAVMLTSIFHPAAADTRITDGVWSHFSIGLSPDGTNLYSEALAPGAGVDQITMTPAGGGASIALTDQSYNSSLMDVSRTSGVILFTRDNGFASRIEWMPGGGGVEGILTPWALFASAAFSFDGSQYAFTSEMVAPPDTSTGVFTRPFPSGTGSQWTDTGEYIDPQWSPGGRLSCIHPDGLGYLQVFRLDGPDVATQLTSSPQHHIEARWSPDGSRIACVRWLDGNSSEIVTVDAATGMETAIVSDGRGNAFPKWSPDGQWVLYQTAILETSSTEIRATRADGSLTMVVTAGGPAQQCLPEWSRTGAEVYYIGYNLNTPQIWMNPMIPPSSVEERGPAGGPSPSLRVTPNPNPGRGIVSFDLPQGGQARVTLHSADGRQELALADGHFSAGSNRVAWDLQGRRSQSLPAGVYFVRLETRGRVYTARFTVVR